MTDHREEAEKWLETAKRWPDDKQLLAITDALIGIGHALLAGPPELTVEAVRYLGPRHRDELRRTLEALRPERA